MAKSQLGDKIFQQGIWYNEIAIPVRDLDALLAQSCAQFTVLSNMVDYPVFMPGSSTLLKHRGRFFLVCTRHQLRIAGFENVERVCLPLSIGQDETIYSTSSGARWTSSEMYDSEYHEISVFDFTEPCLAHPDLGRRFFDIREQHPDFRADWVTGATAYGFPTARVDYDHENKKINVGRLRVPCRFGSIDSDSAVHSLSPVETLSLDPDGMSGGPVFFVLAVNGVARVHLAGITVTGGATRLRVVKAGAVLQTIDSMIEDEG